MLGWARVRALLPPAGKRGATNLLLVTFLIPVSAMLFDALVLGGRLDARHYFGMALIGYGLAAIDGRLLTVFERHAPSHRSLPRPSTKGHPRWAPASLVGNRWWRA